jgi:SAM-dependent methyltransferase
VNRESRKTYGRFRFVREPLDSIVNNEETHRDDFPLAAEMNKRRYPVRALRYWWLSRVIDEEVNALGHPPVVVDVGCDRGIIKRFIPPIDGSRWIGLDMDINRQGIELAKYDERIEANFDDGLPVPDMTADIAICSHVLEHLPRPGFTMGEIFRILKPGGLLVVGVPTAPKFIAKLREKQFQKQLANGSRVLGQHIHVFWDKRLRELAESAGFEVEYSTGTSLIRKKGSKLEDYPAWIRFNQIGASLFPAIGQELCMQLRKP